MKHPNILTLCAAVLAVFLLSACSGRNDRGAEAPPEKIAGSHAGGHGAGGEKITHFSDASELFVEFPFLVANQPATFIAHFTRLADFKPVVQGRLTVLLAGGAAAEERFFADAPSVPGIFKPVVTPKAAGKRLLTLIVESDQGVLTHELGAVEVYPDTGAARAARSGKEQGDEGIAFTKEQQWKIDFATTEAVLGVMRESVAATGTIRAQPDGEALLAAPMAGLVKSSGSFPRVGQAVKKGQVLAYFVPRLGGETDYASLQAAAAKAGIALEQARRERERMESLFRDEAVAEKRLIAARASEGMAAAEHAAARQRLGQFGNGSGGIALRAPIDGIIADAPVASGAFVAEGTELLHIANTEQLWLEARVPESDIVRLGKPAGAWFAVDGIAGNITVEAGINGRLVAVGGVVDAATRTVPVVFEFANPGLALPVGMTVRAHLFAGNARRSLLVPGDALQDESGTQVVYVQTGGESYERRIVQAGMRDAGHVEIRAGLEPGERIVSKGAYLIRLSATKSGPSGHAH